ncbi:STY0301 family protein [Massilia sp. Root335]|jgi:hypothetical protein|uniref:STY0301 family protein n=1 Tax=Massilia sp. Root335 TaxID=1736517 RepID=UPI00070236F7|nr:STY0301 family protein [Massilia sp. Root335]KQV49059.1 hypothetical protein ASC93_13420 [Massilia sp. Root335]
MKIIFCAIFFLASCAAHAEVTIACPTDYPSDLLIAKGVPAGWTGIAHVAGSRLILQSAGVIAGPPAGKIQGIQMGTETRTKKGFTLTFVDLDKFTEPLEKWMYCAYGMGGDVQLLRRLPDTTRECVSEYTKTPYGNYDIRTICR